MKKIDDKTFADEINICKQQSLENNGQCSWGKCSDCGVVPLLIKLNKEKLIEDEKAVRTIKKEFNIIIS